MLEYDEDSTPVVPAKAGLSHRSCQAKAEIHCDFSMSLSGNCFLFLISANLRNLRKTSLSLSVFSVSLW